MELKLFLKGLILGFSIAAPVGPIGILCIRRTLQYGRLSGLFSGLGAACADAFYAIIAVFGLTYISNFLLAGQFWLQLGGGLFLLYLGWRTFKEKPLEESNRTSHSSLINDFLSVFFLTATNPLTILSFIAVFAALGLSNSDHYSDRIPLLLGVFLGSSLWWLLLSEGITLFKQKVSRELMLWINRVSGAAIFVFGIAVLTTLAIFYQ